MADRKAVRRMWENQWAVLMVPPRDSMMDQKMVDRMAIRRVASLEAMLA